MLHLYNFFEQSILAKIPGKVQRRLRRRFLLLVKMSLLCNGALGFKSMGRVADSVQGSKQILTDRLS